MATKVQARSSHLLMPEKGDASSTSCQLKMAPDEALLLFLSNAGRRRSTFRSHLETAREPAAGKFERGQSSPGSTQATSDTSPRRDTSKDTACLPKKRPASKPTSSLQGRFKSGMFGLAGSTLRRAGACTVAVAGATFAGFSKSEPTTAADLPSGQLHTPAVAYPDWDSNWDFLEPSKDIPRDRIELGPSRHILLVRHGQYDETSSDDKKRILTKLGRRQAQLTGERLAAMVAAMGPRGRLKAVHSSDMARAKETCDIIMTSLPAGTNRTEPEANLNEGTPAHNLPTGRQVYGDKKKLHGRAMKVHYAEARIEAAFRKHFHRSMPRLLSGTQAAQRTAVKKEKQALLRAQEWLGSSEGQTLAQSVDLPVVVPDMKVAKARALGRNKQHEFEIVVAHGNVIRFMALRALQLPPEAWLRLSTFNCSVTYIVVRPSGRVSLRTLGDVGHLPEDSLSTAVTFSGHEGWCW